ncbi:hypothetical protein [Mesorhizobium silamurunense]|uniref:hypothetical protein n=1 Tax=Mesorhizobium silamurunense TaxID=499528 RepID=UPI0017867C75|nr:hypothetical protein [Mesorhizobium silamurunense]
MLEGTGAVRALLQRARVGDILGRKDRKEAGNKPEGRRGIAVLASLELDFVCIDDIAVNPFRHVEPISGYGL